MRPAPWSRARVLEAPSGSLALLEPQKSVARLVMTIYNVLSSRSTTTRVNDASIVWRHASRLVWIEVV